MRKKRCWHSRRETTVVFDLERAWLCVCRRLGEEKRKCRRRHLTVHASLHRGSLIWSPECNASTGPAFKPYCVRETLQQSPNGACPSPTDNDSLSPFSLLLLPFTRNTDAEIVFISHVSDHSLQLISSISLFSASLLLVLSSCLPFALTCRNKMLTVISQCARLARSHSQGVPFWHFVKNHWCLTDTHKVCCDTWGYGHQWGGSFISSFHI